MRGRMHFWMMRRLKSGAPMPLKTAAGLIRLKPMLTVGWMSAPSPVCVMKPGR